MENRKEAVKSHERLKENIHPKGKKIFNKNQNLKGKNKVLEQDPASGLHHHHHHLDYPPYRGGG